MEPVIIKIARSSVSKAANNQVLSLSMGERSVSAIFLFEPQAKSSFELEVYN